METWGKGRRNQALSVPGTVEQLSAFIALAWPFKIAQAKTLFARVFVPLFSLSRPSSQSSWFHTHGFAVMMMLYLLLLIVIGASNSPTFVYYWHRMFHSERWIARGDKLFFSPGALIIASLQCTASVPELWKYRCLELSSSATSIFSSWHLSIYSYYCVPVIHEDAQSSWKGSQWCSLAWTSY